MVCPRRFRNFMGRSIEQEPGSWWPSDDNGLAPTAAGTSIVLLSSPNLAPDLRKRGQEGGLARVRLVTSKGEHIHMTFTVGETVVYPNHGAAVIEDIEMRTIKGEEKQYLVLRIVAQQDLVVRVPACNLDLVGVRDVVDKEGLDRVFDVLRAVVPDEPTNWSRRYKANLEKLHSGDVMKVAEVVRDLWRRERDRGLSAGEKRMLAKARQILVSELALAEHTNEDKAETILDEVLAS
jgi:CarD family transcriptional regulator